MPRAAGRTKWNRWPQTGSKHMRWCVSFSTNAAGFRNSGTSLRVSSKCKITQNATLHTLRLSGVTLLGKRKPSPLLQLHVGNCTNDSLPNKYNQLQAIQNWMNNRSYDCVLFLLGALAIFKHTWLFKASHTLLNFLANKPGKHNHYIEGLLHRLLAHSSAWIEAFRPTWYQVFNDPS